MSSGNSRLRKPITAHRRTTTVVYGKQKVLIERKGKERMKAVLVK